MKAAPPSRPYLAALAWVSLLLLIAAWFVINVAGDQYWWTVAVLYGPRWIWGMALLGIIPYLIARFRRGILLMLVGMGVFVLGIIDFRIGLGRLTAPDTGNLHIMEFNAQGDGGGEQKTAGIIRLVNDQKPDLVVLAECSAKVHLELKAGLPAYASKVGPSLCLFSRDEIRSWEIRDPSDFWKDYGSGAIIRSEVRTPGGWVRLGLVHLATPRRALRLYNEGGAEVESIRTSTAQNLMLRARESAAAREWILANDSLPTLVAGDFNLPVSSAIYRQSWGDFDNALSLVGVGQVHTKVLRLWGVRIDHVLGTRGARPVRAWIGPDLGSDHLPVLAEFLVARR